MRQWITIIGMWALGLMGMAQKVKFEASVNKTVVAVDESFTLTFSLNAAGTRFRAPNLTEHFRVYSGPNQTTRGGYANGRIFTSISYSYVLVPLNEGEYVIEPASIVVDGKTCTSEPIKIKVVKGSKPKSRGNTNAPKNDPPQTKSQEQQLRENLFVRLELDRKTLYEGDQLLATYKLYSRVDLANLEIVKMPEYEGFFTSEIDQGNQQASREVIDGKIYNTLIIRKAILFPQRSGTLSLSPVELSAVVQVQDGKPINTFFGPRYRYKKKKVSLKSNEAQITVKPLPADPPASFEGAVGSFKVLSTLDKQEVEINEAINLKYRLSGQGNIKLIELPESDLPTDFEAYDPRITSSTENQDGRMRGQKTWEYLIIPRAPGTFEIPAITFSYFDPDARKYKTVTTEPYVVAVAGGGSEAGTAAATTQRKKDIQRVGKDIRYIQRKMGPLHEKDDFFFGSLPFVLGLLAPLFLLGGTYLTYHRYRKLQADTVNVRKRKASRAAQQHLRQASTLLKQNDRNAFFEEIFRALTGYLRDKLAIPSGDLNREAIRTRMLQDGWSEQEIEDVVRTLEQCEMARFAPAVNLQEQELFEQTAGLIERMEGKRK